MNRKQGILFVVTLVILIGGFAFWFARMAKYESQNNSILEEKIRAANEKDRSAQSLLESQKQAQTQAQAQAQSQPQTQDAVSPENSPINDPADSVPEENPEENKEKKEFTSEALKISLKYDADENLKISEETNLLTVSKEGKKWKIRFYEDKKKQDFESWYNDHYGNKDNPGCVYNEGAIKSGDYESKSVVSGSEKCEDGGNFIISADKSRKIKIYKEKETEENINKILEGFKFN